jgi:hypothetical protein
MPLTIDTDVDGFPFPFASTHEQAETVAFGYPARALVFEQRVEIGPLAIRDMRRRLTASDGLAFLNRALDFRSDLVRMAEMFFRSRGTAEFLGPAFIHSQRLSARWTAEAPNLLLVGFSDVRLMRPAR